MLAHRLDAITVCRMMNFRLPGNQEEPQLRQEREGSTRPMSGRLFKHARPHREAKSGNKTLPPQDVRPKSRNGGVPGKVSQSCARPPSSNRQPGKAGRSGLEKAMAPSSAPKRPGSANISPPSSNNPANPRKPNVTYNLYINVCDDKWKDFDPGLITGSSWEENVMSSGLAKACAVFCNIKSGRIHVSKLRPALHTLEVLVTSDEMYQTLKSINVDESGTINLFEFLEAVNKTSPFAETDAFQNTLRAFRQMKNGTVGVDELKSVLTDLEVYMSSEEIEQTLDHTRLNKNKKVDVSEFLRAARDLQTHLEEEELQIEYSTMDRRPFHDVAELINAEARWRRKYRGYFDEDTSSSTSLFPLLALPSSDENTALVPQKAVSSKTQNLSDSKTASNDVEGEGGEPEHHITGVKKSQPDITEPSNVEGGEGNQEITVAPNSLSDATEEKHEGHDDTEGQKS